MKTFISRAAFVGLCSTALLTLAHADPVPVAQYSFNNTLNSDVGGAPALTAVNPLGTSSFVTDTVNGHSQTVYNFSGAANPLTNQAGLSLSSSGLISNDSVYSVEMVFKFTQRPNAWRRILDVNNRQSDNGFYVDPSNNLDIFPAAGGAAFTNNDYHDVFLVNNNGVATFYLDGSKQATASTHVMDLDTNHLFNFFLDNLVGGGQGEYSSGDIALIRLYNEALSAPPPAVPLPGTFWLMLSGMAGLVLLRRRPLSMLRA